MTPYIVLDFETISAADLKQSGAWRYWEDASTEILTLRWTYHDSDKLGTWHPGEPPSPILLKAIEDGVLFVCHNASFEKAGWRNQMVPFYGWPEIPDRQWDDTMARCANLVIPQEMGMAVRVLRLPAMKDEDGSSFTVGLSKKDKFGNFPKITPATIARVDDYCGDDCLAQKGLRERIGTLSPAERNVWLLDQRINQRGFKIDLALVDKMQQIVDEASAPLLGEWQDITGIQKLGSKSFKPWLEKNGLILPNLQKETIARALADKDPDDEEYDELAGDEEEDAPEMLPEVRRALKIKQLIGSASVKKLKRAKACVSMDGRIRYSLQYHGAGPGLWAGRLLQPHNFPRGTLTREKGETTEEFIERKINALMSGDYHEVEALVGPAVETVISSLRHIIVPSPGRELVVGDFAGIQARLVLAGAGQHDKTALMASGADVYIDMACDIYGMEKPNWALGKAALKTWVEEFKANWNERRQIGKNSILGLGFQMGWRKFRMRYCKDQPTAFAEGVVKTYRQEWAPEVPKFWRGLENAARDAVWYRKPMEAYGVLYQLEDMWLTARLPSGRKLFYFNPQPLTKEMQWSTDEDPDFRRAWTFQAKKMGVWKTIDAFGGLLAENYASGLARDLLVDSMFKAEKNGLPLVLTVHDELIADAEKRVDNAKVLRQIMEDRPKWAVDLMVPVEAETWAGDRYRK